MAIRRPARVKLAESAYTAPTEPLVPEHLVDLETVPGRCYSSSVVALCSATEPHRVCVDCSMTELGEFWEDLIARCNRGMTKAQYARLLAKDDTRTVTRTGGRERVMS